MYLLLICLPLLSFLLACGFGRFFGIRGTPILATFCVACTSALSLVAFYEVGICGSPCIIHFAPWFHSELFDASWGFLFDSLTVVMLVVVTVVSTLVHMYSIAYMGQDPHLPRFMSYLSIFTFFMLMLVTADNFIQMFFGWEGVGVASYLLINFWYTRVQANKSAIKAMLVNRVGDFGLALGIMGIFALCKSVHFHTVFACAGQLANESFFFFNMETHALTIVCLLLFVGAVGKSAQLGLHTWLPDAMEGPTPVSALIHAATMVTAGVFMIARCSPVFEYAPSALLVVTVVGAMTSFFAATTGVVQNDLKRVIAYSTCSQLGYMVFACGLSNYSVSMFHLINHAYFKALLFLSAGSVIHALNDEQDMRRMGGLLQVLPYTYVMILIGSLALMGFPFLTGFYSKDVILEIAYAKYSLHGTFAHWLGVLSAGITAFYSFRLIYLTFISNPNGYKNAMQNAHDAPLPMAIPLFILCIGSIFVGYLTKDLFIGLGTPFWNNAIFIAPENLTMIDAEFIPTYIKWLPVIVSLFGAILSMIVFHFFKDFLFHVCTQPMGRNVYIFLNRRWLFDRLQNELIGSVILKLGYSTTYKLIDKGVIEVFGPKGFSFLTMVFSKQISNLQSGLVHQYAFIMFIGVTLFMTKLLLWPIFASLIDINLYFVVLSTLMFTNYFVIKLS